MTNRQTEEIIVAALERYAAQHPRPMQVTQKQAAEMLGLCDRTVRSMMRAGILSFNACGMIPIEQVDRARGA